MDDKPPQELENETLMSLNITAQLKQLAMKHKLKEVLFQRFKAQLSQKSTLETMFMKVEKQITDNILEIRANNFFLFKVCLKISTSKVFTVFIVTCIIANSFVLALDRFNIDEDTEKFLEYSNIAFFSVFCLELILKMTGMGFQQYFRDRFNWFDSLVVLVSTVDFTLNQSNISIPLHILITLQINLLAVGPSQPLESSECSGFSSWLVCGKTSKYC